MNSHPVRGEPSRPGRDLPISQQPGHVWCADGAQILVCRHLPSASPPPPDPRGLQRSQGRSHRGPQLPALPKSPPGPSPVHSVCICFPLCTRDQGVLPPCYPHPPTPPCSCLGSFPQVCSFSALHPAVSEPKPIFAPKYHLHLLSFAFCSRQ